MNHYTEMMQRHQQEVNALPLGFAFGQKQFDEMMRKWGLHPEQDIKQICSIGAGGYIQKKDVELFRQTMKQHREEREASIAADRNGTEFVYQMFLSALNDHEYGYTRDETDALDSLGYTLKQVAADKKLRRGFEKACREIIQGAE